MTVDPVAVSAAVTSVRQRIAARAGSRHVDLVAVTKGFGRDAVDAATAAGCTMIGENYAQELVAKLADLDAPLRPAVHFLGRIQTNKVRLVAGLVDVWHSVDRPAVATEIARRRPGARVYVQVNTTAEAGKGGCAPEDADALVDSCRAGGLEVAGLMTVGPTHPDPVVTRAAFARVRAMADAAGLPGCSMGMTDDFEIAVEEGATLVRIGSALFGERPRDGVPDRLSSPLKEDRCQS